jgi:hypothetical protein
MRIIKTLGLCIASSVISPWETAFGCRPLSGGHALKPCQPFSTAKMCGRRRRILLAKLLKVKAGSKLYNAFGEPLKGRL